MKSNILDYTKEKIPNTHLKYKNQGMVIVFKNHMYKSREHQKYKRGFMFKTQGQIKDFIIYAFDNYGLLDYKNKGRVVIIFKYLNDTYGLLVSIEEQESRIIEISIITVDKIDTRHYTNHTIFTKEKNRINMQCYDLKRSYLKFAAVSNCTVSITLNGMVNKYTILYSDKNELVIKQFLENVYDDVLVSMIINKMIKRNINLINKGSKWLKLSINEDTKIFLQLSIEELYRDTFGFIILNVIKLSDSTHHIEENKNFVNLNINKDIGRKRKSIQKSGLKIVKKCS